MVLIGVLVLAIISTLIISLNIGLTSFNQFWIPIVVFVVAYIAILALYFIILFIWSLFYLGKKEYKKTK